MTGFSYDDAGIIHECLNTLFENDASAARPSGSINVSRVYWWDHSRSKKIYSPIAIFRSLNFTPKEEYPFYTVSENPLYGTVEPEIYVGD